MAEIDVLIIGAGQAGLGMGYTLKKKTKFSFQILEGAPRIGDNWRSRYDELTLFTTREISQLPEMPIPGDPQGYPPRDQFGDYLEHYAEFMELPVKVNCKITKVVKSDDGGFISTAEDGTEYKSRSVVLANGPYQTANVLGMAKNLSDEVVQITSEDYKNSDQVKSFSRVLVVGDGAYGRDMAAELSLSNTTFMAKGSFRFLMPERILGLAPGKYLTKVGIVTAPTKSLRAKMMKKLDPFPNRDRGNRQLRRKGITIKPRLKSLDGTTATFKDGTSITIDAICWAVGFRDKSWDWVEIPEAKDEKGNMVNNKGSSPVKNLFFMGRAWQTCRASALVFGVRKDSEIVAGEIVKGLS